MSFEGFPFNIGWELTLECNLRCNHCASVAGLIRPDELTTEEALRICDQFPALLVQEVDFTGGEPLLRNDWFEIALHLKSLGISTNILTNGLAVTSDVISRMKTAEICNVGISLDGLKSTHDCIRGLDGSYGHVLKSIDMMLKENIGVIVITTVNSLNIRELPEIFNLLEKMGVKNWRLQPVIPLGRVINFCELEMNAHDILELGYFIQNWALQPKTNGLKIICSDGLEYIEGTEMVDRPWRGCPGGWVTCGITSDGKVKGCLSLPDNLIEGDLRKDDLWSIWFNPDSFAYTRHFTPDQLGLNCKSCDKSEVCLGGCSSNSYAAMGSFHNDPYCFYNLNKKLTSTVSGNIPKDGDQTHKICRPPT